MASWQGAFQLVNTALIKTNNWTVPFHFHGLKYAPFIDPLKKHLFWPLKTPLYSKQGVELIIYITVVCQVISYCFSEPGKFFLSEAASRRLVLNCFEPIENAKHICTKYVFLETHLHIICLLETHLHIICFFLETHLHTLCFSRNTSAHNCYHTYANISAFYNICMRYAHCSVPNISALNMFPHEISAHNAFCSSHIWSFVCVYVLCHFI